MKALVGAFNQEKALVGAFSVIVQLHLLIVFSTTLHTVLPGIVFSDRPVEVGERVCIRLTELSIRWSGVLRLGFCSQVHKLQIFFTPKNIFRMTHSQ